MNSERQKLLDDAAQKLRESGCSVVSIMATWPDGKHVTSLKFDAKHSRNKRGLGRSFDDICRESVAATKLL